MQGNAVRKRSRRIDTDERCSSFTPDGTSLITSSLLGKLARHAVTFENENVEIYTIWNGETKGLEKVSAIALSEKWLAVGGFGSDEKGLVEIWCHNDEVEASVAAKMEHLSVSSTQA